MNDKWFHEESFSVFAIYQIFKILLVVVVANENNAYYQFPSTFWISKLFYEVAETGHFQQKTADDLQD